MALPWLGGVMRELVIDLTEHTYLDLQAEAARLDLTPEELVAEIVARALVSGLTGILGSQG